mmetsp:Transcript_41253/g.80727  ORF Transcript_41253/g.80727 Transcript_41253/m.80727 type:complete len:89 (+) Transcript_41253:108-374(+)
MALSFLNFFYFEIEGATSPFMLADFMVVGCIHFLQKSYLIHEKLKLRLKQEEIKRRKAEENKVAKKEDEIAKIKKKQSVIGKGAKIKL